MFHFSQGQTKQQALQIRRPRRLPRIERLEHRRLLAIVDFEGFQLGSQGFFNGPADNAVVAQGQFGPEQVGTIEIDGVGFVNRLNATFGSWSGFSISNRADTTTPGVTNQYSAYPGEGFAGSNQYAVAFGYDDLQANLLDPVPFDPTNPGHLTALPSIYLPSNHVAQSVQVTTSTYSALSMLQGDSFAKVFGGTSGNDPDFFTLSVFGLDENGQPLSNSIDLDLADFRFTDNAQDYILDEWALLDLAPLSAAQSLHFNLSSSDVGDFGMNTPAYFAIDDLSVTESAPNDTTPPTVTDVIVAGSIGFGAWTNAFIDEIDDTGPAGANNGYGFSVIGVTRTIPWYNVDTLYVHYSEPVVEPTGLTLSGQLATYVAGVDYSVSHSGDLTTVSMVRQPGGEAFGIDETDLGPATTGIDRLLVSIAAGGVADLAGNLLTTSFNQPIDLLPGDGTGDGSVFSNDVGLTNLRGFLTPASPPNQFGLVYDPFFDVTADAAIFSNDVGLTNFQGFDQLPTPPAASSFSSSLASSVDEDGEEDTLSVELVDQAIANLF